jgi:hypothetical protein
MDSSKKTAITATVVTVLAATGAALYLFWGKQGAKKVRISNCLITSLSKLDK